MNGETDKPKSSQIILSSLSARYLLRSLTMKLGKKGNFSFQFKSSSSFESKMDSDSEFEDFEDDNTRTANLGFKPQKELFCNRFAISLEQSYILRNIQCMQAIN